MGRLVETGDDAPSQGNPTVHYGELGFPVLDPDLVVVDSREEHADSEGDGGGGGGGRGRGIDAQVLDADRLEVELGLLRFDGEYHYKNNSKDEEEEQREEEEEAAAATFERGFGGRRGRARWVVVIMRRMGIVVAMGEYAVIVRMVSVITGWRRRRVSAISRL